MINGRVVVANTKIQIPLVHHRQTTVATQTGSEEGKEHCGIVAVVVELLAVYMIAVFVIAHWKSRSVEDQFWERRWSDIGAISVAVRKRGLFEAKEHLNWC